MLKEIIIFFIVSFMGYLVEGVIFGRTNFVGQHGNILSKVGLYPKSGPLNFILTHMVFAWGFIYLVALLLIQGFGLDTWVSTAIIVASIVFTNCIIIGYNLLHQPPSTRTKQDILPISFCNGYDSYLNVILYIIGVYLGSKLLIPEKNGS